jgi:signal transduction histidine kinase
MRWASKTPRVLTRLDVRLALLLAGATAAFTSLLLCGLLAYALSETLEEQASLLDDAIAVVAAAVSDGSLAETTPLHRGVAYRVIDDTGRAIASRGVWPPDVAIRRVTSLRAALGTSKREYLVRERRMPGAVTIAAALPLRHFVGERRELATRAAIVVVLGLLGSVGLGVLGARRALRPVRDAFEHMSAFSADVAHELRTRVNRTLNTAEIALSTTDDATAKDDALETIRETAEEMRRTIEQLLLLAKGEEGRLPLVREHVDVGALLDELVSFYAPAAERAGKTLDLSAAPVEARADRALVERAIANLLENALRHSAPGARIHVGATALDGVIVIVVEDSGPGIAAADAERIFERFVRLDPARGAGGVGLGLPIARMIARLHAGDLDAVPSALGGTAFRLTIQSAAVIAAARR